MKKFKKETPLRRAFAIIWALTAVMFLIVILV